MDYLKEIASCVGSLFGSGGSLKLLCYESTTLTTTTLISFESALVIGGSLIIGSLLIAGAIIYVAKK